MRETIRQTMSYLRRIRKYIWLALAIFIVAIAGGYYFSAHYPGQTQQYLEEIKSFFASMQEPTPWGTFLMILQNNVEAMLLVVGLGVFAGFFSLTFLLVNGFILGVMMHLFFSQGLGLVFLAGILPHGLLEIPCLLLAAAVGFKVGMTVLRRLARRPVSLTQELGEGIRCAIVVIVPLLFLAALIETYITPLFIAWAQSVAGA